MSTDPEPTMAHEPQDDSVEPDAPVAPMSRATASMAALSLPARLEAILYLKGRPLTLGELAGIAGIDRDTAELALITLMADYAHRDTALEIHQDGQHYALQLRESLADLVQDLLPVDLSTAALRTLATIALRKRLLQSELVDLRGSGAYDHIKELLAHEFIERKRQSDGRSYWLSLSDKFHRTFTIQTDNLRPRTPGPGGPKSSPSSGEGDAAATKDQAEPADHETAA